jgi:hypothetical protein
MKNSCALLGRTIVVAVCCSLRVITMEAHQPGQSVAQPPKLKVCQESETDDACGTWTFLDRQGTGTWRTGAIASLHVESWAKDTNSIVVSRSDSTGAEEGLTGVYRGTVKNGRFEGTYETSWPGHWATKSGNWFATPITVPKGLPDKMTYCGPGSCGELTWKGDHYDAVYPGSPGWLSIYTVVRFAPDDVLIERVETDPNGRVVKAVLRGTISQGARIQNGEITFTPTKTFRFNMGWGPALHQVTKPAQGTVPASYPVYVAPNPVVTVLWACLLWGC